MQYLSVVGGGRGRCLYLVVETGRPFGLHRPRRRTGAVDGKPSPCGAVVDSLQATLRPRPDRERFPVHVGEAPNLTAFAPDWPRHEFLMTFLFRVVGRLLIAHTRLAHL